MIRKAAGMIITISLQMIVCAVVIMLIYDAGVKGFAFGESIFTPETVSSKANGKDMIVIVEEGASELEVARLLQSKGLIKDYKVFFVQALLYRSDLQPGTYTFNTSMTSEEMLKLLIEEPETEESQ